MGERTYVTDLVKDDYLAWRTGEKIIIGTPTGSGKTTFVIATLLKYAVAQDKHIIYYCNRRILYEQFSVQSTRLIKMVFGEDVEISKKAEQHLHLLTYQGSELTENYPIVSIKIDDDGNTLELTPDDILYYVFDEAHYFLSDAQINPKTNFWYDVSFEHGISVFLTATPKPLIAFLEGRKYLTSETNRTVYRKCKQRDKLRKEAERVTSEIMDAFSWDCRQAGIEAKMPSEQALIDTTIRRRCNPLSDWFAVLRNANISTKQVDHVYWYKPDYSYVDPMYFREYDEILKKIEEDADDKWLIFVDDEILGRDLTRAIKDMVKESVAFISSQTVKRKGLAKDVYSHIIQHKSLPVRIVVATSVMDCGISLHDATLKNVVIINDDETSFLQMLGRRRVNDGESIKLYIKVFEYLTIHNRYNRCMQDIQFLIKLSLKNRTAYLKSGRSTANRDGNTYGSELSAKDLNKLIDEFISLSRPALITRGSEEIIADCNGHVKQKQIEDLMNYDLHLMEFDYSKTAFLGLLSKIYSYHQAIFSYRQENEQFLSLCDHAYTCLVRTKDYEKNHAISEVLKFDSEIERDRFCRFPFLLSNAEKMQNLDFRSKVLRDDTFFLQHQLKWMDKVFDMDRWCGFEGHFSLLVEFLDKEVRKDRWLREDDNWTEQSDFAKKCKDLMLDIPIVPSVLQKDASRYELYPQKYPGKDKLNKSMKALSLPYLITAKQRRYEGKKKTCWKLVKIE